MSNEALPASKRMALIVRLALTSTTVWLPVPNATLVVLADAGTTSPAQFVARSQRLELFPLSQVVQPLVLGEIGGRRASTGRPGPRNRAR